MNCSVCNAEKPENSDFCPNCGIDVWVDPALKKILEENQEGTFGFEYPEYHFDEVGAAAPKRKAVFKWFGIALAAALVTYGGITGYQFLAAGNAKQGGDQTSQGLPTFETAFPASLLSKKLSPICPSLQSFIESGITSAELEKRVNGASTASQSVTKAKEFVAKNPWVSKVAGPEAWLDTVSGASSQVLSQLAAASNIPAVQNATVADIDAAYRAPLQSAWLAECGLSGEFAAKQANLLSYQRVATSLLARAAEPEPTKSAQAQEKPQQTDQNGGGSTTVTIWPPKGMRPVAGFAGFAYSPINDFCSVGEICAKFKLASKTGCSAGANIWIYFVDSSGKILDTYKDVISIAAGKSITFEANTDAKGISGWDISNISCR